MRITTDLRTSSELLVTNSAACHNFIKDNHAQGKGVELLLATMRVPPDNEGDIVALQLSLYDGTQDRTDASEFGYNLVTGKSTYDACLNAFQRHFILLQDFYIVS